MVPPVLAGHRMGRLLVIVELPILCHLGSIARNGAGLGQSDVAIDCAEFYYEYCTSTSTVLVLYVSPSILLSLSLLLVAMFLAIFYFN